MTSRLPNKATTSLALVTHWNRLKAGGAIVHEAIVLESVPYLNTTSNSEPWRAGEETETDVTHPVQYWRGGRIGS